MDQNLAQHLIGRYQKTFAQAGYPQGYFETRPTIPWIGRQYNKHKILIYASAENLSDGWIKEYSPFFTSEIAHHRHAEFWEKEKMIRIQPFDTGGLRLVGILGLKLLGFTLPVEEDLTDHIAIGNLSKFSLNRVNNRNCDVHTNHLQPSLPYLQHDLEVLAPRLVINASGKPFPFQGPPVVSLPQYTHTQLGFYHLRSKVPAEEVLAFKSSLQQLIKRYSGQLKQVNEKVAQDMIKNDSFTRYFCWAQQQIKQALGRD